MRQRVYMRFLHHLRMRFKRCGFKRKCETSLTIALLVTNDAKAHKDKLQFFMEQFYKIIRKMESSNKELSIAIRGYGLFAAPCKAVNAKDVDFMYIELIQRCKQMYLTEAETEEDNVYQLPNFLQAIASVILYMDSDGYRADRSDEPSVSGEVRAGKWKVPTFKEYLDLFRNLLNCDQLKESIFSDETLPHVTSPLLSLSRLLYDELIKSILKIIEKLDLSLQKQEPGQEIYNGNQGNHQVTKRGPALSNPMFTLVTRGLRHRWPLESCLCDSSPATTQRLSNDHGQVVSLVVIVGKLLSVTCLSCPPWGMERFLVRCAAGSAVVPVFLFFCRALVVGPSGLPPPFLAPVSSDSGPRSRSSCVLLGDKADRVLLDSENQKSFLPEEPDIQGLKLQETTVSDSADCNVSSGVDDGLYTISPVGSKPLQSSADTHPRKLERKSKFLEQKSVHSREVSEFHRSQDIVLPSFCHNPSNPEEHRFHTLDVRLIVLYYLEQTKSFRIDKNLFVHLSGRNKGKKGMETTSCGCRGRLLETELTGVNTKSSGKWPQNSEKLSCFALFVKFGKETAFKLGLSSPQLADAGLDALEDWSSRIPPDTMELYYKDILPSLDGYLTDTSSSGMNIILIARYMGNLFYSTECRSQFELLVCITCFGA
ncbi:unnamed protein product [Ranitomeya imitator]|uniref:DNA-PKcs N-terminal domain-containing protein n=1 Tax=Ranitomeya imitator TaxID=111125 RepID=A0ABN9LU71_9NEOB|nr:unnamed protein product [Ranitomeya imitator]